MELLNLEDPCYEVDNIIRGCDVEKLSLLCNEVREDGEDAV